MAGIAAMVLTGILGNAMGLNNTAAFMASCVAFVAVSMWIDSRISLRRRASERAREATRAADRDDAGSEPGHALAPEQPERDGRGT